MSETNKNIPEEQRNREEHPLSSDNLREELQERVTKMVGNLLEGPGVINEKNSVDIAKRILNDETLKKSLILELKRRIYKGEIVSNIDHLVQKGDPLFKTTTLGKLSIPAKDGSMLFEIEGVSYHKDNGPDGLEDRNIKIDFKQTNMPNTGSSDRIDNRVLADALKVILYNTEPEIADKY